MFKITTALTILAMTFATNTFAKDADPQIATDNAHLSSELTFNIAKTAIAMGVQQPLTLNKEGINAKISGSNSTICIAKLSSDAEPKMLGISCK